jgi:hypothetical protein
MVMMKRQWLHRILAGAGLLALTAASASAQVVQVSRGDSRQSIGFTIGGFFPRGTDGRDNDDTLLADLNDLAFEINDFRNVTFGGEYLFALGNYLEGGIGASYYQKSVSTVYRDFVNTDGSEIEQELRLRIVPITATVRFLPLGRGAAVEPYVGGGIGFFNWRYSEVGDFVDFTDSSVFTNRYVADGTAVGPVILAGVRVPIGDVIAIGGELRWQKATGDTGGINEGFLGDKIDLGGTTANFTIHFRF